MTMKRSGVSENMAVVQEGYGDIGGPSAEGYHDNLHNEPIFGAFICPLTKTVMQDPVILESGQTFEREAIEKWLSECEHSGRRNICPLSLKELTTTCLTPNIALHDTIEEWNQRNEAARLNIARLTLTPGSSDSDILQALSYIQKLCQENRCHKHFVRRAKVIPTIIDNLGSNNRNVQCKALETLRMVAEDDAKNKEAIAAGNTLRTVVKFLIHDFPRERQEAVLLLCELSKSEPIAEKMGELNGAILLLVGMASGESENAVIVQKAEKTLENLERCMKNVLQMAENGRLGPLLRLLLEGSPEIQLAMVSYLGELVLSNDLKALVGKTAGPTLVNLMVNGSDKEKAAAIKALDQISSHKSSAELLVEAGILPPLVKNLLSIGNKDKETSANILVNIVTYCADSASITLDHDHRTLVSEDMVHSLLHLISNTGPAIECKLLEVLVGLSSTATAAHNIAAAMKSSGAATNMNQFIEVPQRDLRAASIKLLCNISPHMQQELTVSLCDCAGYLAKLIEIISENKTISEEQAAAIGILAELPDRDPRFVRRLQREKAFDKFIDQLLKIRRGETRGSRYVTPYFERLARVLSKLVYNLENGSYALTFVRENNVAALFADLLQTNGIDDVQIISAVALENLSQKSKRFVRPDVSSSCTPPWSKKKPITTSLCRVHCGYCSMKENFCLVEGKAVGKLVSCLDHPNKRVIETALAALCTLLDDGLDIQQGVFALSNADGVKPIMQVLKNNNTEILRQKAVWAVERLLRTEDVAREVSADQNIVRALLHIFQHGDVKTKQIAEHALKHVERLPVFSIIGPKIK